MPNKLLVALFVMVSHHSMAKDLPSLRGFLPERTEESTSQRERTLQLLEAPETVEAKIVGGHQAPIDAYP
jgi:hypothetical protein